LENKILWIDACEICVALFIASADITKRSMSILSVFLAHKNLVLTAIAGAVLVMYAMPLDSIIETSAAKGGDPGPPIPPVPGEGNHYGWVKKGGPPPKPK
jgi:hypothetical protein